MNSSHSGIWILDGSQSLPVKLLNLFECGKCKVAASALIEFMGLLGSGRNLTQYPGHAMCPVTLGTPDKMVQGFIRLDWKLLLEQCRSFVHLGRHEVDRDSYGLLSVKHLPKSRHHSFVFWKWSVVDIDAAAGRK